MRPCVPSVAVGAVLLALAAAPVWAGPTVDSGPMATAAHDDTQAKINAWLADSASDRGDDEVGGCPALPLSDGKMHGEVGASIGTGGYRNVYGVVHIPLGKQGDKGELTIAASQGRGRGWYRDEAFEGPYAYAPGPYVVSEPMLVGRRAWRSRASACDARFAAGCLAEARDPCAPPLR